MNQMKGRWKKSAVATLVFILLLSMLGYAPVGFAEGPNDPAPEIFPSGPANGVDILFDNAHGQTAGAADWVIDGGFSDFAHALANRGYHVKELRKSGAITLSDLQEYEVLIIPEANIPFKKTEQDALIQYVQNGGSLFFIADHYNADRNKNRWDSSEVFNGYRRGAWDDPSKGMTTEERNSAAIQGVVSSDWLASNFGVRFRYNAIGDITANLIVPPEQSFGITNGIKGVAMHAGSTLAILDPTKAKGIVYLPKTTVKWSNAVDQGVYNGGGVEEGPFVAISKLGAGKAAFIGDSSPVEDATPKYLKEETGGVKTTYDGFLEADDANLLAQLVDWLAKKESYTSFDQVSGLELDQPTPLLEMETPQTSTEPQPEPWAAPASGYKWYDPSTFKAGSYGAPSSSGGSGGTGGTTTTGLFFSEYVEGSGYNKALEIFNGTGSAIDLSGFTITLSNTTTPISLGGTLANGDVYVLAHSNAAQEILSVADATVPNLDFNGDDSVTLKYNGTVIDVIGTAGVSFGVNKTLVRKSTVTTGKTVYDANEWDGFASDTFTYLGSHVADGMVNHAPTVINPISNQSIMLDGGDLVLSLANVFQDADGDRLGYRAASDNSGVATVTVLDDTLTVTPVAQGKSILTVTAEDGRGGSVQHSFEVTVSAPVVVMEEDFESGTKTAYAAANITLSSGSWNFNNALIGESTSDRKNGSKSARIRAAGSITMNFDVSGAKAIKVKHANFGSDAGANWKVQYSIDSGTTWLDASSPVTSTGTLTETTIAINHNGTIRFRIVVSGISGKRINIDDIQID